MHFVTYLFYVDGTNPDEIMEQFCIDNNKEKTEVYDREGILAEIRRDWKFVEKHYPQFKGKQDDDNVVLEAAKEWYSEYEFDDEGNAYEWYNPCGNYDWCIRPSDSWFRFTDWKNIDGEYVKDVIDEMKVPYCYVTLDEEWESADSYDADSKARAEKRFFDTVKSYGDNVRVAVYDCHE